MTSIDLTEEERVALHRLVGEALGDLRDPETDDPYLISRIYDKTAPPQPKPEEQIDRVACPTCGTQRWRWFQRAICEQQYHLDLDDEEPWWMLDEDGWEYVDDVVVQPSSADDPLEVPGWWACIDNHRLEADDPIGERLDAVVRELDRKGRTA